MLHNGCYSSSHHIHNPSIRKQELEQGLLFQKAFTEVPPNNLHVYVIGHSNRVRRLPVDPREEGICSLSSGNVAVLSTVEVLLLRKKGKVEYWLVSATQMESSETSKLRGGHLSHKCFCEQWECHKTVSDEQCPQKCSLTLWESFSFQEYHSSQSCQIVVAP